MGGGAGGAAAPPTFQQEGLSPPNVHMLSLLFNVEPPPRPQLLNHSYAYDNTCITIINTIDFRQSLYVCILCDDSYHNTIHLLKNTHSISYHNLHV